MEEKYSRNRIYINKDEQKAISKFSILLGGCGIGSVIAECAIRLGFESITLVDGDKVEESNLNRQNYRYSDIGKFKVEALADRLSSINPNIKIKIVKSYISIDNIETIIDGHDVAINALDFSTEVPLIFDKYCQQQNIPVLHPYNIGWGGLLTIITPNGASLNSLENNKNPFNEINFVKYASNHMSFMGNPQKWLDEVIEKYTQEEKKLSPPQLSVASWFVASMCATVLFNIATKKPVKTFPEFYISTIKET